MKVSKAVNLFLDYHKLNSQKTYDQGLQLALGQIQGPFSRPRPGFHIVRGGALFLNQPQRYL